MKFCESTLTWHAKVKLFDTRDNFVCVEPGYVRGFVRAAPGENWVGEQTLSVIHTDSTHL